MLTYAGAVHFFGISNIGTYSPLRGLTFVKHAPFLTGSSVGPSQRLSTNAPTNVSPAPANGNICTLNLLFQIVLLRNGTDGEAYVADVGVDVEAVHGMVEVEVGCGWCQIGFDAVGPVEASSAAMAVAGIGQEDGIAVLFALNHVAGHSVHGGVDPRAIQGVHEFQEFIL